MTSFAGDDIIPIPGTTNPGRLEENVGAMQVKLTDSEVKEIRHLCENTEVTGSRYPPGFEKGLFVTTVKA